MPLPEGVSGGVGVEIERVGRPKFGCGHEVFQGLHEGRPGDQWCHGVDAEQGGIIVAMLGVGRRVGQEHQPGPAGIQRLDCSPPGILFFRGRFRAQHRAIGQQSSQFQVFVPGAGRIPSQFFQQVGATIADQDRGSRRGWPRSSCPKTPCSRSRSKISDQLPEALRSCVSVNGMIRSWSAAAPRNKPGR